MIRFLTPLMALAAGLLFLSTARADFEMVQEMESGGKKAKMVTRFKLDEKGELGWVRVDQPDGMSLVTDFKRRQILALNPTAKLATISNFRALLKKLPPTDGVKLATRTKRSEKVGELETDVYEGTLKTPAGDAVLRLWVAKAHPLEAKLVPLVKAYAKSPVLLATAGLGQSLEAIPGVVVKSEVEVGGQTVTTSLLELLPREIPQAVFEIPKDYKKEKRK